MKEFLLGFLLTWIITAGFLASIAMGVRWQIYLFGRAGLSANAGLGVFFGLVVFIAAAVLLAWKLR